MKLSDYDEIIILTVLFYMQGLASKEGRLDLREKYKEISNEIRSRHSLPAIYYDETRFAIHEFQDIMTTERLKEIILQMR